MEGHEAVPIPVVTLGPAVRAEPVGLAQHPLVPGAGDHAVAGIEQHHAGALPLARAQPDALDDGAGLRLPVEMDGEDAQRRPLRATALPHARAVGGDLRAAQACLGPHVDRRVGVAAPQGERVPEPGFGLDLRAEDVRIGFGAAMGDHPALKIAQPEIEIDRVGRQDHPEPLAGIGRALRRRIPAAGDQGGVGRPPAHVAAALVEVPVDQLDGVQGEVHAAGRARLAGEPRDGLGEVVHAGAEARLQGCGQRLDLGRDGPDLLRDDREAGSLLAGMGRLDERVQRQQLHAVGDRLDGAEVGRGPGLQGLRRRTDDVGKGQVVHATPERILRQSYFAMIGIL